MEYFTKANMEVFNFDHLKAVLGYDPEGKLYHGTGLCTAARVTPEFSSEKLTALVLSQLCGCVELRGSNLPEIGVTIQGLARFHQDLEELRELTVNDALVETRLPRLIELWSKLKISSPESLLASAKWEKQYGLLLKSGEDKIVEAFSPEFERYWLGLKIEKVLNLKSAELAQFSSQAHEKGQEELSLFLSHLQAEIFSDERQYLTKLGAGREEAVFKLLYSLPDSSLQLVPHCVKVLLSTIPPLAEVNPYGTAGGGVVNSFKLQFAEVKIEELKRSTLETIEGFHCVETPSYLSLKEAFEASKALN